MTADACPECGAPLPEGGSCRDLFHKLLLLEGEATGGVDSALHFFVVGTYVLQHPIAHRSTEDVYEGLRAQYAAMLDGRTAIGQIRRENGGLARVTVPKGEPLPSWPARDWPLTVADACGAGVEGFADRVMRWAHSVREVLDADAGVGQIRSR